MNIFEKFENDKLFYPLSAPNKELYIACAIKVYNVLKTSISQVLLEDDVIKLIDQVKEEIGFNSDTSSRDVYNYFISCGWWESDRTAKNEINCMLTEFAIIQIPNLIRLSENNKVSFGGYSDRIISDLKSILNGELYPFRNYLKQVYEYAERLQIAMNKIVLSTKKDIEKILAQNTINDIIREFSVFLNNYNTGCIYELESKENITSTKSKIIGELISDIYEDPQIFDNLVADYQNFSRDVITADEAAEEIEAMLNFISFRLCTGFKQTYNRILQRCDEYVRRANTKIKLMTNSSNAQIEKNAILLNYLLSLNEDMIRSDDIEEVQRAEKVNAVFGLMNYSYIDGSSLRYPTNRKDNSETPNYIDDIFDESGIIDLQAFYNKYGISEMNRFAKKLLKDKECVDIGEVKLENDDDFHKICALVFGKMNVDADYIIEYGTSNVEINGYSIPSFTLKRK